MEKTPKEKKTRPPKEEPKKKVEVPEEYPDDAVATDDEIDEILLNIFG